MKIVTFSTYFLIKNVNYQIKAGKCSQIQINKIFNPLYLIGMAKLILFSKYTTVYFDWLKTQSTKIIAVLCVPIHQLKQIFQMQQIEVKRFICISIHETPKTQINFLIIFLLNEEMVFYIKTLSLQLWAEYSV